MSFTDDLQLSQQEKKRYLRQTQMQGFGESGQLQLKQSKALIIGVGGLGCPAAQYLAAAGVGEITLVDEDQVSLSNLQRQILFSEADIGKNKAQVAKEKLQLSNTDICIKAYPYKLDIDNAPLLIKDCDLVLDCTDNFHSRYLINDMCAYHKKPWVYASVLGFDGQVALIKPQHSCFRCLYPELAETPNCNQAGVLGAVPGIVGSMQALVAIQLLSKIDKSNSDRNQLQLIYGLDNQAINLSRDPACDLCNGEKTYLDYKDDYTHPETTIPSAQKISWKTFYQFTLDKVLLIDVREKQEHQRFNRGSLNIPLSQIEDQLSIEEDTCYVFYCESGQRSLKAASIATDKKIISKNATPHIYAITDSLMEI